MDKCFVCGKDAHPDGWYESLRLIRGAHPDDVKGVEVIAKIHFCDEHRHEVIIESGHASLPEGIGRVIANGAVAGTIPVA